MTVSRRGLIQGAAALGSLWAVGCASTKELNRPAASIITPIAITTAVIITQTSRAMPTAVMTESSEKMMSRRPIWMITDESETAFYAPARLPSSALSSR